MTRPGPCKLPQGHLIFLQSARNNPRRLAECLFMTLLSCRCVWAWSIPLTPDSQNRLFGRMVSNRIPHVPARLVVIQILDPPGTPKGDTPKENDSDLDYTILRLSLALARGLLRPGITNQTCLNLNLVLVLTLALALALLGMQCFYSAENAEGSGTRRFDPVAAVDRVAGVVCSATVESNQNLISCQRFHCFTFRSSSLGDNKKTMT